MGLTSAGALDDSVLVDFSSRVILANKSLLDIHRGLIMGGLNSIIKKKGSMYDKIKIDKNIAKIRCFSKVKIDVYL